MCKIWRNPFIGFGFLERSLNHRAAGIILIELSGVLDSTYRPTHVNSLAQVISYHFRLAPKKSYIEKDLEAPNHGLVKV